MMTPSRICAARGISEKSGGSFTWAAYALEPGVERKRGARRGEVPGCRRSESRHRRLAETLDRLAVRELDRLGVGLPWSHHDARDAQRGVARPLDREQAVVDRPEARSSRDD